jgi:hypothetical protein
MKQKELIGTECKVSITYTIWNNALYKYRIIESVSLIGEKVNESSKE